jgi:hypothetical protein
MQQHKLLAADSRLPLRAPLALAIFDAATLLGENWTLTPPTRHLITRFRAMLVVSTNYAFSCRVE